MRTSDLRWKELIRYLATFWTHSEEELKKWDRGRTLPLWQTVYCLINPDGVIKYIGQTGCLRRRIGQHTGNPKMERLGWTTIECFTPAIPAYHTRFQAEMVMTALAVPIGNMLIAARRTADFQWREFKYVLRKAANGE